MAQEPAKNSMPIAVTMGEPAGIGGELSLMAWQRSQSEGLPPFYVIDCPIRLAKLAAQAGWSIPIAEISEPEDCLGQFHNALPVLPLRLALDTEPGVLKVENAAAVIKSIDQAVGQVKAGKAAALVTNPIHKSVLYQAGFKHPGHTEYLAELAGDSARSVMMLACEQLRVVPVTVHISLKDAATTLSADEIIACGRITAEALERDFGIDRPRLAVAGLNPHAGEDGKMGREEIDIIAPAVQALRQGGIDVVGPLSADTMFHAEARATYDAALCMYHDQALIPLKTLDFHGGVNITLGLPFIRTSPDHGTALPIAGTGQANPNSFINAIKQAALMAENRRNQKRVL